MVYRSASDFRRGHIAPLHIKKAIVWPEFRFPVQPAIGYLCFLNQADAQGVLVPGSILVRGKPATFLEASREKDVHFSSNRLGFRHGGSRRRALGNPGSSQAIARTKPGDDEASR